MGIRNVIIGTAAMGLAAITGCEANDIDIEGTAVYCMRDSAEQGKTNMGVYVDVSITVNQGKGTNPASLASVSLGVQGNDIYAVIFKQVYGAYAPNPATYLLKEPNVELPGTVDYAEIRVFGRHVPFAEHFPLEEVDCVTLDGMLTQ